MSDENNPLLATTERFVAYLDGELPETATRELEQTLNSDPAARIEIEKLNRAWELLDLLPRPNVPEECTSRTVTALQTVMQTSEETTALRLWIGRKTLFVAGLLLIAVIGFGIGRRSSEPVNDPLLDDLSVIENLELLQEIGDVQFLRDLQTRGGFDGRPSHESQ